MRRPPRVRLHFPHDVPEHRAPTEAYLLRILLGPRQDHEEEEERISEHETQSTTSEYQRLAAESEHLSQRGCGRTRLDDPDAAEGQTDGRSDDADPRSAGGGQRGQEGSSHDAAAEEEKAAVGRPNGEKTLSYHLLFLF